MSPGPPSAREREAAREALELLGDKSALAPDDVRALRRALLAGLARRGGPPPVGPNAPEETHLHQALQILRHQQHDVPGLRRTLRAGSGPVEADEDRDYAEAAAQDRQAAIEERLDPEQEYERYEGPLLWDAWLDSRDDPERRQELEERAAVDAVDPQAAAARDVAARNQARPAEDAVAGPPKPGMDVRAGAQGHARAAAPRHDGARLPPPGR